MEVHISLIGCNCFCNRLVNLKSFFLFGRYCCQQRDGKVKTSTTNNNNNNSILQKHLALYSEVAKRKLWIIHELD